MAGIVFQTGFDHYSTLTHRFNSVGGTSVTTTTTAGIGRNGTAGMRQTNSTSALIAKTLPAPITEVYFAFAYSTTAMPLAGSSRVIAELRDTGTRHVHVRLHSDGTIRMYSGGTSGAATGTLIATVPSFAMLPNVFYHFEWYTLISNTVGVQKFRVNEVELLASSANLDTQNTANNTASEIVLAHSGDAANIATDFDDVVIRDDDWNGDENVKAFLPTGIGATNQWTATGAATTREAVDESAPNSDTDYAEEATVGELSLFTFDTIPTTSTITAVVPLPFAKKTDAGTAQFVSVFRDAAGPSNHDGVAKAPSNGAYEYHPDVWMDNPATSNPFTPTEWNDGEVGIKRTA